MSWRDYFYFSKGERSGLIVLLCLITIAGILLIKGNNPDIVQDNAVSQSLVDNQPPLLPATDSAGGRDFLSEVKSAAESSSLKAENTSTPVAPSSANRKPVSEDKKESVPERVNRLTSYSRPSYARVEKFKEGTVVELNTADTTILKKVPGIGSAFAKRIVGYRNLLGGYYSATQLSEVYGVDEERYNAFVPWFTADPTLISKLSVNKLPQDSLRRHPYLNYGQAKVIAQLRRQKGQLTGWENLQLLDEFTDSDIMRLQHYLSFE